ncbi:MAG TPA: radical SAM protein, partial [bacterium]|nr:radical SAM protein [bacterium]
MKEEILKTRAFLDKLGSVMEKSAAPRNLELLPPKELHIELTYRCTADCLMCDLKHLKTVQRGEEISLKEIKKSVEEAASLKDLDFIVLSGGEPWLREDLSGIVRFFKKRYPAAKILILSNLMDTELALSKIKEIEKISGLGNLCIGTSIDGIGAVHDRIRGRKGAFESLNATAAVLRTKYPSLFPVFNMTLLPENSDQLFEVYRWAQEHGIAVSSQVMVQKKSTKKFRWGGEHVKNIDEDINRIISDIYKRRKVKKFSRDFFWNNLDVVFFLLGLHYTVKYISSPRRFFPNCPCGEKFAMLSPGGDLYFCPVHKDRAAGNLREKS